MITQGRTVAALRQRLATRSPDAMPGLHPASPPRHARPGSGSLPEPEPEPEPDPEPEPGQLRAASIELLSGCLQVDGGTDALALLLTSATTQEEILAALEFPGLWNLQVAVVRRLFRLRKVVSKRSRALVFGPQREWQPGVLPWREFRAVVDFVAPHERAPWVRLRKTPRPPGV